MTRRHLDLDPCKEIKQGEDFYQSLRRRIRNWAGREGADHPYVRWILLAPDFVHLLTRLLADPRVPAAEKVRFGIVMAYFVAPVDLLPEALLGPAGYLDDVCLTAYALNRFVARCGEEILREHWCGEEEILWVIQDVLAFSDHILGTGLWRRVRRILH